MLRIIECFAKDGSNLKMEFLNELTLLRKRIFFVERCYKKLDDDEFFKYCRFACV